MQAANTADPAGNTACRYVCMHVGREVCKYVGMQVCMYVGMYVVYDIYLMNCDVITFMEMKFRSILFSTDRLSLPE
jgi:hypothetical protein